MRRSVWCVPVVIGGVLAAAGGGGVRAAVDEVRVEGVHLEQTSRCNAGGAIHLATTDSRLSILGDCTDVVVEGGRNWILVEHAKRIVMQGDRNTVLYQDRSTRVEDRGKANSVSEKWQQ